MKHAYGSVGVHEVLYYLHDHFCKICHFFFPCKELLRTLVLSTHDLITTCLLGILCISPCINSVCNIHVYT